MPNVRPKDIPTTASYPAPDDWEILDGTVNGTRKLAASYRDAQIMTRAPGSYLQSDAATSGRGVVYTGGTRQNIAGVPVVEFCVEVPIIPTANPSSNYYLIGFAAAISDINPQANAMSVAISSSGALEVIATAAGAFANVRRWVMSGFRAAYSGQAGRLSVVIESGTGNPTVRWNNVALTATNTAPIGTPPDWLAPAISTAFMLMSYLGTPAIPAALTTPILGSLSTTERDTWFTTGRFPAWVHAGGSAVQLITNGDMSSSTGWSLQSAWAITGGQLVHTGSSNFGYASQPGVVLERGARYRYSFNLVSRSGAIFLLQQGSNTTIRNITETSGIITGEFTATEASIVGFKNAVNGVMDCVIDDFSLIRLGALTLPGVQGIGTVRDLTTIGGNQGRLVGIRPCLALPAPRNIAILPLSTTGAFLTLASTNPLAFSPQRIMRAEVVVDTAGADLTFRNNSSSTNDIVTALTDIPSANTATALTLIAAQTRLAAGATVWGSLSAGTGQLIIELADTL